MYVMGDLLKRSTVQFFPCVYKHCSTETDKQPFVSDTSQCVPFSRNFNTTKNNRLHGTKKRKTNIYTLHSAR